MIRRPPRSTLDRSSAASDVYKRQVKNLWLQELRRRNKMPLTNEQTEVPDIIIEKEKDADLATAAFNLLGERCRKLLIMFYFRKKSYKELASFLGFGDERTAKNQKYRCLE